MLLPFLVSRFGQESRGRLSTLLAPVSPLCDDSAHFSCKISHACACAKRAGFCLQGGYSHEPWLLLEKINGLLAGYRTETAEKRSAEPSGLCLFAFGWHFTCSSVWTLCFLLIKISNKFSQCRQWILYDMLLDFSSLPFTCCCILESRYMS